jgi:hypothetical protein
VIAAGTLGRAVLFELLVGIVYTGTGLFLTAGKKYLGQIAYQDGATTQGTTIVRVDS